MQRSDTVMARRSPAALIAERAHGTFIARVARLREEPEGGVAMLLALMVILLVLTISISIAGVTLSEVKPTQIDRKTVTTEAAAEAGFDIALNRIRAASSSTTTNTAGATVPLGSRAALPCGTFAGAIDDNSATDASYSVSVLYWKADPTGHLADSNWVATYQDLCSGTPASPTTVPSFVSMISTGTAATIPGTRVGSGNRVLATVYALSTTNQNIPGGEIPFYSNLNDCFSVYDTTGKVQLNDLIDVATCSQSSAQQKFSYTANLQLEIIATNGATLCMAAVDGSGNPTGAQHSSVALKACDANSLPPASPYTNYAQVWSYNDSGQFQISNATDSGLGTYCLNLYTGTLSSSTTVAGLATGDYLDLDSCGAQTVPTASVGAGAAGTGLRPFQLVNYLNFGRCIDDTNQSTLATWLIGYPCKQDPLATNLTWNQKYYTGISGGQGGVGDTAAYGGDSTGNTVIATTAPAAGCQISNVTPCQFVTFPNGAGGSTSAYYCLEAGGSANPSAPVAGTIVTVQPCSKSDNYQLWTYTKAYVSNYAQQYLIQPYGASVSNLCLSMTIGSTPPGLTYNTASAGGAPIAAYGYISLDTCTGTGWQKWNAPPGTANNEQKNTYEQTNP